MPRHLIRRQHAAPADAGTTFRIDMLPCTGLPVRKNSGVDVSENTPMRLRELVLDIVQFGTRCHCQLCGPYRPRAISGHPEMLPSYRVVKST